MNNTDSNKNNQTENIKQISYKQTESNKNNQTESNKNNQIDYNKQNSYRNSESEAAEQIENVNNESNNNNEMIEIDNIDMEERIEVFVQLIEFYAMKKFFHNLFKRYYCSIVIGNLEYLIRNMALAPIGEAFDNIKNIAELVKVYQDEQIELFEYAL